MAILKSVWRLLVGIKDALVLLFLLLFFGLLYALMSTRPTPAVREGALLLKFRGPIVEQPAPVEFGAALGSGPVARQYRLRDVVFAIDTARTDPAVKVVVLDLDGFQGGGQVALGDVGEALDRVRKSGKPVFAYATGYTDDSYQLAAHASRIFLDPMGLALFAGPGGSQLYYRGLLEKLGVTAHVYRVGRYKSAVEPFILDRASPDAKQAATALASALWQNWQAEVARARPQARIASYAGNPAGIANASGGDLARAALASGIVDQVATRQQFNAAVEKVAGEGARGANYAAIDLPAYVADHPFDNGTAQIGVATIAGTIVDGEANPGTAGGDTIAKLIDQGVATGRLKALVLRVDSPGGSALASERIRQSVMAAKRRGLPVVVSMGNVAASGGYWVTGGADRIFAEPATITGSIGIFGIVPTFENTLAKAGVSTDGVQTTPLSGQPDVFGGTNAAFDTVIQRSIEAGYARFVNLVAQSRKLPAARVDEIGQGRVWDGGSARQLGLVDRFGGIDDAIAEAARLAKLDPAARHAVWLDKPKSWTERLAEGWFDRDEQPGTDALTTLAQARLAGIASAAEDARLLTQGAVLQARCLECGTATVAAPPQRSLFALLKAWLLG